ncbi:phytoene/squalene synthase family protein [Algimonas porphyrae]|uniref:Squalene synthase HpnD n=1 Tax=Algimonas porphyrae TaxID=1128113 RepID=A0ABQ5UYX6_9PROT|nr:phytoene/squalene synthase family protein [Algimonas porphyrae]GLQ19177.1 squalene synthase HpnD [Algimonas porphyrae]
MPDPQGDRLARQGRQSIEAGSKSFALASRVLPPRIRDDASMLYAWCRYCDDVIDGQEMGHGQIADYRDGQAERLKKLRDQTRAALHGQATDPIFQGLARVVERNDIPHRHAFELLKGFEMDAEERVYHTIDDLLDYAYHVAGVVGVMMAMIMGTRDAPTLDRASDLGLAFQLTNIARDVIDDARADRVFVPQSLLIRHGAPVAPDLLKQHANWPAAHKAAIDLIDIAEDYYASARTGIRALPFRCAWAISAALSVYREIGEVLRVGGPEAWHGRVGASASRKMRLAVRAGRPALMRSFVREVPRDGFYMRPAD